MEHLARWCFRHRRIVLAAWALALAVTLVGSRIIGADYRSSFALPNTGSQRALDLLRTEFPSLSGETDTVVFHTAEGSVLDASTRARTQAILAKVARLQHVKEVGTFYDLPGGAPPQVSADGRTGFVSVIFDQQADTLPVAAVQDVIAAAQSDRGKGLEVDLEGVAIGAASAGGADASAIVGVIAAAIILYLAFRSIRAMAIPLIAALMALGVGLSTISLLSHPFSIVSFAPTLAVLVGLGVGIDYGLFIITRYRSGLAHGRSLEDAAAVALNTSGRAVVFAGTTVCIALLGLILLGVSFLNGLAVGASVGVAFTVLAAMTLVPALFGFFGMGILSGRERRSLRSNGPTTDEVSGAWLRWARLVERRPLLLCAAAAALMLLIAAPVMSMRLGQSDQGNDPPASTTRAAYDRLAQAFGPGFNGPLLLVTDVNGTAPSAAVSALSSLETTLRHAPGVASVSPPVPAPSGRAAVMQVYPTTGPQDKATTDLVKTLRSTTIPAAVQGTPLQVNIGGATATGIDFSDVLSSKLPLFIGVVVLLAFVLLMTAFRSMLIPLVASVMNLVAVGASFGIVVAIFQFGWSGGAIGIGKEGPIDAFMPVILFAILFGLSMDYQVFLVSRMHEEWSRTRNNRQAVTIGQADTGRVITTASSIMVLVFLSFVFGGERIIKLFGVGLSAAVLLDALLIRTVLVPALMHMLGASNWWIPSGVDRVLPRISIEGAPESGPARQIGSVDN
ncbi:MAG: MMPL family transporter [Candidatus Dormibacteria bacterium]